MSHRQAITDVVALTSAARLLRRGRRAEAIIALERVGRNALTARLSESVFAHDAARHRDDHPGINWAAGHLAPSPNLWAELASLREEPSARPAGDWIVASVEAARATAAEHATARVDSLAQAFERAALELSG